MIRKLLILALLAAGPAWALNMSGFKDAPLTRLTGEELKAFRAAIMKALDETGYSTAAAGNWGTAEVGGGDRERLKRVSEQMDRLFAS